jgi:hypothetical protein
VLGACTSLIRGSSPENQTSLQTTIAFINRNTTGEKRAAKWIRQRELKEFIRLPVFILGLEPLWKKGFQPLYLNIKEIWVKSGPKFTSQYLSECSRALVCWSGNEKFVRDKTRIALTHAGLPKILPIYLRRLLSGFKLGKDSSKLVLRAVLTVLSVYRVIGCGPIFKWETITDPFKGISPVLPEMELRRVIAHIRPIRKLSQPKFEEISSSSGPNYPKATWSSAIDAIALLHHPKQAIAFVRWCRFHKWDLPIVWWLVVLIVTMLIYPIYWILNLVFFRLRARVIPSLYIGRLAAIPEARGKIRIVAIVDYWTQLVLKPLHHAIFRSLRAIRQDGTFDQVRPMKELIERVGPQNVRIASFDLSAATDRLPAKLQVQILNLLGLPGDLWITLLDRPYYYVGKFDDGERFSREYKYAVGQPMGAYSSWGMLALTHHIIVQVAAARAGEIQPWFRDYAIIGDDIIIANDAVANCYRSIMNDLGVEINMTKSHHGNVAEFAKKWIHTSLGEITPIGAGNILMVVRNVRLLPNLLVDMSAKGFSYLWNSVHKAVEEMPVKSNKEFMAALATLVFCLGPSGLLRMGNQRSVISWLERWSTNYYGGIAQLPSLLSSILHAERLLRCEQVEKENARNREEGLRFKAIWTRYPLNGYVLSSPWIIRIAPTAKSLSWLLGLSLEKFMDTNVYKNPLAVWRLPWPIQINIERIFWIPILRCSPGYWAYAQDREELVPLRPAATTAQVQGKNEWTNSWLAKRPELSISMVQQQLDHWKLLIADSNTSLLNVAAMDWSEDKFLSTDFVEHALKVYGLTMEILYPPLASLPPNLSLVIYPHSSAHPKGGGPPQKEVMQELKAP